MDEVQGGKDRRVGADMAVEGWIVGSVNVVVVVVELVYRGVGGQVE